MSCWRPLLHPIAAAWPSASFKMTAARAWCVAGLLAGVPAVLSRAAGSRFSCDVPDKNLAVGGCFDSIRKYMHNFWGLRQFKVEISTIVSPLLRDRHPAADRL